MRVELTPEQVKEALRIRATGYRGRMAWHLVARRMGLRESWMRAHFEPGYLAAVQRQNRKKAAAIRSGIIHKKPGPVPYVPPEILAERDRRINTPYQSVTAAFFGDPKPGYSAADRRA